MSTSHQEPPPLPPQKPQPVEYQSPQTAQEMDAREVYNVVTDTVTGVNIRLRDNLFQLAVVIVCALAGALIAYFASNDRALLALGAIGGLVAGLILSGAILAIYRGMQHLRGKHK